MTKIKLMITIDPEQKDFLEKKKEDTGASLSWQINKLIFEARKKEERQKDKKKRK